MPAEVFRYRHVGDRPLRLEEEGLEVVLPGTEFDRTAPIVSNANFEPISDNAKAHQAKVDAEDAERLKEHRARIGFVEPEAAAVDEPAAKRSRKPAQPEPPAPASAPEEA